MVYPSYSFQDVVMTNDGNTRLEWWSWRGYSWEVYPVRLEMHDSHDYLEHWKQESDAY